MKQSYLPKKEGQKTISQSRFVEFFTNTHPLVAISMFILIGLLLILYAYAYKLLTGTQVLLLYPLGIFSFTLIEYLVHRFVFHMEITNKIKEKIQYNTHGIHHEFPNDRGRLVMPPIFSLPLSAILFLIAYFFTGKWAFTIMGGFFTGYGLYLFVHYIVHVWKMPKNRFKTLWIYHKIHHFQNEEVAFGVSSHLWDRIFGTMPEFQVGKTNKNKH